MEISSQFKLQYTMISDQDSLSSQQCSYEIDQVVWGKIRGYPYWPGYVKTAIISQIHEFKKPKKDQQRQKYQVVFFGDNTHSLLTKSKIRKYYQNYHQMYAQGRKHKKLGVAIKLAEQKLVQNNQDILIFKQIRNQIDKESSEKKKKVGRPRIYSSMVCSQQQSLVHSSLKKGQFKQEKQSSEQKQQQQGDLVSKLAGDQFNEKPSKDAQNQQQPKPIKRKPGRPKGWKKVDAIKAQVAQQQECQIQPNFAAQQQEQFEQQLNNKPRKIRKLRSRVSNDKAIVQKRKQNDIRSSNLPTSQSQLQKQRASQSHFQKQKADIEISDYDMHIPAIIQKLQCFADSLSVQQKMFIERVQFSLQRQNQLIQTILNCENLTMNILQYLLDRGVPQIIQKGSPSVEGYKVLQTMQVMVTMKYFPQDKKNYKRYQALVKDKKKQSASTSQSKHEDQVPTSLQKDLQIRKKTVNKLEKIMRIKSGESCKQHAIKVESWFREHDKSIGQSYKALAYKTMRKLKDQPDELGNVLRQIIGCSNQE